MTSKSKTEKTRHNRGRKASASAARGFRPYPAGGWFGGCGWCGRTTERVTNGKDIVCKECGK